MFVTVLGRMAGADQTATQTTFTDVSAGAYYAPYVAWAYENKIAGGTTATTFSPEQVITREQLASLLYNFARSQNVQLPSRTSNAFVDMAQIHPWAADAVNALMSAGIISGRHGNRFDPAGNATRAEAATILVRYWETVNGDAIITNGGYLISRSNLEHEHNAADASKVYYTDGISPDAMMAIYQALGRQATGKVAVKLSTGEAGDTYYLDPKPHQKSCSERGWNHRGMQHRLRRRPRQYGHAHAGSAGSWFHIHCGCRYHGCQRFH